MNFTPESLQNAFVQNYLHDSLVCTVQPTQEKFEDAMRFLSEGERSDFIALHNVVTAFNEVLNTDPKEINAEDPKIRQIANNYYTLADRGGLPVNYRIEMFDNLLKYTDKHVHGNTIYATVLEQISRLSGSNDDAQNRFGKLLYFHHRGIEPSQYFAHMQKIYFRMQNKDKFEQISELGIATDLRVKNGKVSKVVSAQSKWPPEKRRERLEKIESALSNPLWTSAERISLAEEALKLCTKNGRSRHQNFNSQYDLHNLLLHEYAGKDKAKYNMHLAECNRWNRAIIALDKNTPRADDFNPDFR